MNPVLLKPQSEIGSQLVVHGRVRGTVRAREYQAIKPDLLPVVLQSFVHLQAEADLVIVEGAGSASEINLRAGDIANMGFARAADVPVVVVGDIDRGGVIASLVGTQAVLDPADAALVRGFIVNRMRGDVSLFADGMRFVADRTGWAPLGLVPHLDAVRDLPAEDAADFPAASSGTGLRVAVLVLPCIANFDDLDPLRHESGIALHFLRPGTPIPGDCGLVILPGSKATIADLAALRACGWDGDLHAHVRRGGRVLGLCGGYQMLGRSIADPDGSEGPPCVVDGLGFAGHTDGAGQRQATGHGCRHAGGWHGVHRLRNPHRPHRGVRMLRGRCCIWPTAVRTVRPSEDGPRGRQLRARVAGA